MHKILLGLLIAVLVIVGFASYSQHAGTAGMCQVGKSWVLVNQQALDNPPFGYYFCHKI